MDSVWKDHISLKLNLVSEIYRRSLSLPKKQPPRPSGEIYHYVKPHGVEIWISPGAHYDEKRNLIYKLAEEGYIKVLDETRGDLSYEGVRFILNINDNLKDIYKQLTYGEKITKKIQDEDTWVQTNIEGETIHLFIGSKKEYDGRHVHLIIDKEGSIRFDNKDQSPSELLEKVVAITTKEGKRIKASLFFQEDDKIKSDD